MEAVFSPEFYEPYALAVQNVFLLCCALRDNLRKRGEDPGVRLMTYRLKTPDSITEKLQNRGLPISRQAADSALRDISGLRVVLEDTQQVYRFAQLLIASPVVELAQIKDYIRSPKPSGYKSLHLIVRVPVCLHKESYLIPVEVQLRTAGMDVWASIEHDLVYKPK
ncbi:MAG: hypothetical protein IKB82_05515 [Clostridia bacterium]|nr:hypothetical protein [Clostridia bacterium]